MLMLLHFVGDLHQPLHCTALFNEQFLPPLGDRGGNDFKIKYTSEFNKNYTQLHSLFDAVAGEYTYVMPHNGNMAPFDNMVSSLNVNICMPSSSDIITHIHYIC